VDIRAKQSSAGSGDSGQPLYQKVVQALRSEILRGAYPIGTPLPSELLLCRLYGVSRHTVREALRHLRDLGLVESHQGKGTLVLRPGGPQVYVHQVNSIADLHDYAVESRYGDTAEARQLDNEEARRLGVPPEETWLRIEGLRHDKTSGEAICAVDIYVSSRFAGIARLLGRRTGPIYALIEDVYGESIGEVEQELRAVPLGPEHAARLGVPAGEMAVEIKRIYRLLDGSPAEISYNHYKADMFRFSMRLRRVRGG
jgi:GntR family transcriptional regulator